MSMSNIDLDKLIESEAIKDAKRKEYNTRPDVIEKRKVYNQKRQAEQKVAREVMGGSMSRDEGIAALATIRGEAASAPADTETEE